MSQLIKNEADPADLIKEIDGLFLMVYASWCPHSQRFLPLFEKYAEKKTQSCARVVIDDLDNVVDRFGVEVYPTVLYFKNGKIAQRLDGVAGVGLDENQLKDFLNLCGAKVITGD